LSTFGCNFAAFVGQLIVNTFTLSSGTFGTRVAGATLQKKIGSAKRPYAKVELVLGGCHVPPCMALFSWLVEKQNMNKRKREKKRKIHRKFSV